MGKKGNKPFNNTRYRSGNNAGYIRVGYEPSATRFINPYNFVPVNLDKKGERVDVTKKGDSLLSGYLDCRLQCRTPLAIPDAQNRVKVEGAEDGEHYKYPFYMAGGMEPMIPGSAVRGVIRNVYETLTDSCFSTMRKDSMITARSEKAFAPGLLMRENSGWKLYRAKRWLLVTQKNFMRPEIEEYGIEHYDQRKMKYESGEQLFFYPALTESGKEVPYQKRTKRGNYSVGPYVKRIVREGESSSDKIEGYYCEGEPAPKRHFDSIFEKKKCLKYIIDEDRDIKKLEAILEVYRDKSINRKLDASKDRHTGYKGYEKAKRRGIIPVYFDERALQNGKLYMSFAALGRKAYWNTLNDIVKDKVPQNCSKRSNLCPACALFGSAEGEKLGSRIRFTDAKCTNYSEEMMKRDVVFAELSSPRISYIPFYMQSKSGATADYQLGYDSNKMEIRGRKFYWHHQPDMNQNIPRNKRNATYDVVGEGAEFRFRIYYDGITEKQLETLEEAVHLNDNRLDGDLCHKIGHGKPLGYGSVKIVVENRTVRTFSPESGWKETAEEVICPRNAHTCDSNTYEALMRICDFRTTEKLKPAVVTYPGIENPSGISPIRDNDSAAHKWFSENNRRAKCKPPQEIQELPGLLDEEGSLVKLEIVKRD